MRIAKLLVCAAAVLTVTSSAVRGAGVDSTAPTLAWADVVGSVEQRVIETATDSAGNLFVAGVTKSLDFPVPKGAFTQHSEGSDVFLMKLSPSGEVVWSTFLGGNGEDWVSHVAVDSRGNVIVAGNTSSTDFPVAHAFQPQNNGVKNGYIAKFSRSGTPMWSSLLGGSKWDGLEKFVLDGAGNIIVIGGAVSPDFPVRGTQVAPHGGTLDGFIARISPSGRLLWTQLVGGTGEDTLGDIALDSVGNMILIGQSASTDFPIVGGFQSEKRGPAESFDLVVLKMTPRGRILWSSYLGGSEYEGIHRRVVDARGNLYLAGSTSSPDFPVTDGMETTYGGAAEGIGDGFLTKISRSGKLLWSTYIGGAGDDIVADIALDAAGNLIVCGSAGTSDFPADKQFGTLSSYGNAFAMRLTPTGRTRWITLIGSSDWTDARAIRLDRHGNVYMAGQAAGSGTPVSDGLQFGSCGGANAFAAKLTPTGDLAWLSVFGGSANEYWRAMTMNGGSFVFVGQTSSSDFPATKDMQPGGAGRYKCFVVKFDVGNPNTPSGTARSGLRPAYPWPFFTR